MSSNQLTSRRTARKELHKIRRLFWANGVADRSADAKNVAVAEHVGVVHDVIVVNLRTYEYVIPDVIANPRSQIDKEVVATHEIVAAKRTSAKGQIEASALPADSGQQVGSHLLVELGLVVQIEVGQNWAVGLAEVTALRTSPGGLKIYANAFVKDNIGAEAWIEPALFRTDARIRIARS